MEQNSSARERLTTSEASQQVSASDLTEFMKYLDALETDRRQLQDLLRERKEEYEMELRVIEREREQEQLAWEKEMVETEERLLSALMSVLISRNKLMKDLKSHMDDQSLTFVLKAAPAARQGKHCGNWWCFKTHKAFPASGLQTTNPLVGTDGIPAAVPKKSCRWWCFRKRHATPVIAVQDAHTSSGCALDMADLQKMAKLEERIRKVAMKKERKAAKKAEQKAKKEERIKEAAMKKQQKAVEKAEKKKRKEERKKAKKEGKKGEIDGSKVVN